MTTTNHERAFRERPEVYAASIQFNTAIKAGMDLRRYELATLAAARRLRSSYCALAHGTVLLEQFGEPPRDIAIDRSAAGLDEVDLAVMDFAEKVVDDATSIDEGDHRRLRELGLSDAEIMDVALAAAVRCFFSNTLDAMRVEADAKYRDLEPALQERSSSSAGRSQPPSRRHDAFPGIRAASLLDAHLRLSGRQKWLAA